MESSAHRKLAARIGTALPGSRERLLGMAQQIPDVIRLGRGDPDLDTPKPIVEAGVQALRDGCTHYTPWSGLPELRDAVANKLRNENDLSYDPVSEIAVTAGAQQGIFVAMQALLDPGDEVLIGAPGYNYYAHVVSLAGGRTRWVPTAASGFVLHEDTARQLVNARTKLIVVINPNNPTGTILSTERLCRISELALEHDLIIISDEIYERLVFDGAKVQSIASLPGMKDRTIVINGLSKAYAMTGWRVGYMAGPSDFISRVGVLKHCMALSPNHAAQVAAIAALKSTSSFTDQMVSTYDKRRRCVLERLDAMGLAYIRPQAGFSVFIDISGCGVSSHAFCEDLLRDHHVLLFPGTLYGEGGEGYVRLSLLAPLEVIREATERMEELVRTYTRGQT